LNYGPGYIGSQVSLGSCIRVTSYADIHCSVSESNENDNSFTKLVCIN